jgi:tRNA(fMet)-specific endonuclease VapC
MSTYLLDSSVIIDTLNLKRGRASLLKNLLLGGHLLACCAINITEIYAGMHEKERKRTEDFLHSLEYHEITYEIAAYAGQLKRTWGRRGITLSLSDVTIAAIAIKHNLPLITDNRKHYPMTELSFYPLPPG